MKKILFSMLLLASVACNYDDEFNAIKNELGDLKERIEFLNEDIGALRSIVLELNDAELELAALTKAVNEIETDVDFSILLSGLANLQEQLNTIKLSIGQDNTDILTKISALEEALVEAEGNNDTRAVAIAEEIAELQEQLGIQSDDMATGSDMANLLGELQAVQEQLLDMLSENAFYNGNVVIRSSEDFAFYQDLFKDGPLKYINGYLEIKVSAEYQFPTFIVSEQSLLDFEAFTGGIEVVTGSVYLETPYSSFDEAGFDFSSLVNVGGVYVVKGSDVLDDNLRVTGGMVLDYPGEYSFPNLRQVNKYSYKLQEANITDLFLTTFIGGSPDEFSDNMMDFYEYFLSYGAIRLTLKEENTAIDFSGLKSPTLFFSDDFNLLADTGMTPGLYAPDVISIDLGEGGSPFIIAPKAFEIALNVEHFTFQTFFDNSIIVYPGKDMDLSSKTKEALELFFTKPNQSSNFSAFIVASYFNDDEIESQITLRGRSVEQSILTYANQVSAPNLASIGNNSTLIADSFSLPLLADMKNSSFLYLSINVSLNSFINNLNPEQSTTHYNINGKDSQWVGTNSIDEILNSGNISFGYFNLLP